MTNALHDADSLLLLSDLAVDLLDRCVGDNLLDGPLDVIEVEIGNGMLDDAHDASVIVAASDFPKEDEQDVLEAGHDSTPLLGLLDGHGEHGLGVGRQIQNAQLGDLSHRHLLAHVVVREQRTDDPLADVRMRMHPTVDEVDGGAHFGLTEAAGLERDADGVTTRARSERVQLVLTSHVAVLQLLGECLCRVGNGTRSGSIAFMHFVPPGVVIS